MDGFERMVDEGNAFFAGLAANNTKDWFEPRKDHYVQEVRKPAEFLCEIVAEEISRITGRPHTGRVMRIYRDVRFSKDKTPYNPHIHMIWSAPEAKKGMPTGEAIEPAFFFESEPGRLNVAHGIMMPSGPALARWRAAAAEWGGLIEDAVAEVEGAGFALSDWGPEPLKRVPKPYDKDHPHGDLIRRKALIVSSSLGDDWRGEGRGLVGAITERVKAAAPLTNLFAERLG